MELMLGEKTDMPVKQLFAASINEARSLLSNTDDAAHDIGHGRRTAENAVLIGEAMGYKNLELLALCGWWHDVGRLIDPPNHERISAELARDSLIKLGVKLDICETVYKAIVHHRYSMTPQTLEGHIVRDADKLDWLSPERWDSCISAGQQKNLCTLASRLPELYEFLQLAPSRELYNERVIEFIEYAKDLDLEPGSVYDYTKVFLSYQPSFSAA